MATRYIAKHDFHCADQKGRKRFYKRNHIRSDGTQGYLPEEVKGLARDHLKIFRKVEITGDVEQATAAPGEKRNVTLTHECGDCGDTFKTAAALGSHSRVHDE